MLKVSDESIAYASLLVSDRFLFNEVGIDKQSLLLQEKSIFDYQPYISRMLRNEDVTALVFSFNLDQVSLKKLLSLLSDKYLIWQGNRFEVKSNYLEEWLELASLIDVSWIIAKAYSDLAHDYDISEQEIITCIKNHQCPTALQQSKGKKGFADNHVHQGGHGHTGPSLLSFSLYGVEVNGKIKWPRRPESTLFESEKYKKGDLPRWSALLGDNLAAFAFDNDYARINELHMKPDINVEFNGDAISYIERGDCANFTQHCLSQSNCLLIPSANRWLLFCTGLVSLSNKVDKALETYIRISNILRNYMIVMGVGLGQFVESFRFPLRRQRSLASQDIVGLDAFKSDISKETVREFRVSPNFAIGSNSFPADPKALKASLEVLYKESLTERVHFVLHFTRSGKREDKRQSKFRGNIKNQVRLLQQFHGSVSFSDSEIKAFRIESENESLQVDLRKAIRGYDVAGNENDLPIEVFAPALRVLRSAKHSSQSLFTTRYQRPFLTIHAGEDYSHLLSGLRAIDEAVYFCDYQSGDRIGHGLALGVSPILWAQRQQTAYVTIGEHLDNLVWCFQKSLEVIQKVPKFTGVLHLLQEKINFWSGYLYEEEHSCRSLYEAWKLRRNCPYALNLDKLSTDMPPVIDAKNPLFRDWIIDFDQIQCNASNQKAFALWQKYILAELDERFFDRREKQVIIHCNPKQGFEPFGYKYGTYFDSISAAELELYEAIQDLQMEKYGSQEIIFEACPTSNIYIGRFEHYHEHPIYRWSPPIESWLNAGERFNKFGLRRGSISVCVNTDDSALMPTSIQNEHRVLQRAAVEHFGVGANKAEYWINRIRQKGVEVFEENHLDWVN